MVTSVENKSFIEKHTHVAVKVAYKSFLSKLEESVDEYFRAHPKTAFLLGAACGATFGYVGGLSVGTLVGFAARRILH